MSLVHIDHGVLAEVNRDLERVNGAVGTNIETLRSAFQRLGVGTGNLDAVLGARDELERDILPALRHRQTEAQRVAELPYSGALTDQVASSDLVVGPQPPAPTTSISALTGGESAVPVEPVLCVPDQPEEIPPEDPPLFSLGGLRNLAGDIGGAIQDGAEWLAGKVTEAWDALGEAISQAWSAFVSWWDEFTADLGAWIDENLEGVRIWIRDNVVILRVIAIVLKVVGWIMVVVGVVLLILAVVASLTGIGALAGVPGAGVAIALIGWGFAAVGAGDMVDTIADWGEGKIDGQELVQALALEGTLTLVSALIPFGFLGKMGSRLLDALPSSMNRKLRDFFERLFRGTPHPTPGRPPRGNVDMDDVPPYARPRNPDRTGPDGHLYPDDFHPTGRMNQQEFYDRYWNPDTGSWNYPPDNGFAGPPSSTTLEPGDVIDRFGPRTGTYVSPEGIPFDQRALPPSSANFNYERYRVVRPMDDVLEGDIAPWFEQPGGGWQYHLPHDVQWYIDHGYLELIP